MRNKLAATAVVALTIALMPFSAFSAEKAPAPNADVQTRTTVGIRTADKGAPDKRGRFDYEILPRKSKQDGVAVYNYSTKPVTVRLLARDATSTPEGEFTAQPSAEEPRDVGSWIALSKTKLTMQPRSMTVVPFQIGVPYNATPGDHTGSILVSLLAKEPKPGSEDVVVEHRVGLRVYLRVPGALNPQLSIEGLEQTYQGGWKSLGFGRSEVDYTVRNTGNVRLSATQQVELLRSFGLSSKSATPLGLTELLPNGAARVHQEFPSTWAIGKVRAKVTLTPAGLDQSVQNVPTVTKETSVFVFPWLIALILAFIALLVGGAVWRRRRRRPTSPDLVEPASGPELETVGAGAGSHKAPVRADGSGKRRLTRSTVAVAGALALVALGAPLGSPARAADDVPVWKATVIPKSGGADDPIELQTSGGCPKPADSILGRVYGKGFPKDGENVIGNTKAGVNPNGPFPAPLVYSIKEFMSNQPNPVALQGTYRIVVNCRTAKYPKSYGDYVAEIKFTSPTTWVASKPVTDKTGPVVKVDELGNPIPDGSATPGAKPGDPSATASGGTTPDAQAQAQGAPAASGDGSPALTASEESGNSALAYVLIIGGIAVAAVTGLLLWRRRA